MNAFYGTMLYENLKDFKDCAYIDLDSENSDQMLYKCTGAIGKKLNKKMEEKPIEGFTNCCPDGMTMVNGQCVEVCQNCKYNDCNFGSSNLGDFYSRPFDGKERKNLKDDREIFNYIVIDVPDN